MTVRLLLHRGAVCRYTTRMRWSRPECRPILHRNRAPTRWLRSLRRLTQRRPLRLLLQRRPSSLLHRRPLSLLRLLRSPQLMRIPLLLLYRTMPRPHGFDSSKTSLHR